MLKRVTFWGWLILFLPASVGLMLHGYLGSFTRFLADDYCSAYMVQRLGFLRSIWYWYRSWSGGYSTSIFDYLLEFVGRAGMPFVVPTVLFIWLLVTMSAVMSLLPVQLDRTIKLQIAIAIGVTVLFSILLLSPNVPQSLYWWGGMRAYSIPLVLLTFDISLYQTFKRNIQGNWANVAGYVVSFSITFINSGFSETFTPVQVVLFAELLVLGLCTKNLDRKSPAYHFLAAGFLGALIGLIVMVASPGNAVRQAYFPESPNPLNILIIAGKAYFSFLSWLFGAPERIFGLLASILGGIWVGIQLSVKLKTPVWMSVAAFINGLIFVFGCFVPAAFGLSDAAPDRTLIIAVYFLVVNFMVGGVLLGVWQAPTIASDFWLRLALFVTLAIGFWFAAWVNIQHLYASRSAYITYARQWDAMDAQIMAAKESGKDVVRIPPKQNWAGVFEPNDNPKFYVTLCMSKYYDIQVLAPNPDGP